MSQRILTVDDSDIAQEFLRASLADIGFDDVVGICNPLEALGAIKDGSLQADLILMDIMMPEMDGIELCAHIRSVDAWSDVPIIMLTSRKEVESLTQAFLAGANDYLTKPFSRVELQARMRSCLRLKSELDRRRVNEDERRANAPRGRVARTQLPALMGTQAAFQNSLLALSPSAQAELGLIVLRIDPSWDDEEVSATRLGSRRGLVAQRLGGVAIEAREFLAHWDEDLFCHAMPGASRETLEQRARQFVDSVAEAALSDGAGRSRPPISVSAGLVLPEGEPAAKALVRAIQALDSIGVGHGADRGQVIWTPPKPAAEG